MVTKPNKPLIVIAIIVLGLAVFLGGQPSDDTTHRLNGKTMGTTWSVQYLHQTPVATQKSIEQRLFAINQVMSTYIKDSELSLLNQKTTKHWHAISAELFNIITLSEKISKLTQGAFDITVGRAVNHYGFGAQTDKKPDKNDIGYQYLKLKPGHIWKEKPVYIDLSAIAKGYGVDEVAKQLDQLGIINYLVEIGGEIKAKGKNSKDKLWQIGIETPDSQKRNVLKIISLDNKAVASSGSYRNFKQESDKIISHTINPKTAKPIQSKVIASTVLHNSCAMADALATAFMVLDTNTSIEISNQHKLATMLVTGEVKQAIINQIITSKLWEKQQ